MFCNYPLIITQNKPNIRPILQYLQILAAEHLFLGGLCYIHSLYSVLCGDSSITHDILINIYVVVFIYTYLTVILSFKWVSVLDCYFV